MSKAKARKDRKFLREIKGRIIKARDRRDPTQFEYALEMIDHWIRELTGEITGTRAPCDLNCPSTESAEAIFMQNCGCLPSPCDIKQMLSKGKVWMCHSNPELPCVATGLTVVPDGFEEVREF